jgi:hypothetical protein
MHKYEQTPWIGLRTNANVVLRKRARGVHVADMVGYTIDLRWAMISEP